MSDQPTTSKVARFVRPSRTCSACQAHKHGSCWAHLDTLFDHMPAHQCPCGCHEPIKSRNLTRAALDDMQRHGTLADYVEFQQRAADTHMCSFSPTGAPR